MTPLPLLFYWAQLSTPRFSDQFPVLSVPEIGSRLLAIAALIIINGFFVTAEFSIVAVRRSRINQLVQEGDTQAKLVQQLQQDIARLLSTTQIGITLSSLALGWIGEHTVAVLIISWLRQSALSNSTQVFIAHTLAIPTAFLVIAYLQIVLGELCPKALALLYSEELARFLGPTSLTIARLFNPLIWILNQSTRCLLGMAGIEYSDRDWYHQVTPEELQLMIATSTESTGLEADERELLTNVFEFADVLVEEVMIPRTRIDALEESVTFQMLLEEVARSGHNYYPVIGESLDDIRGIVRFKELAVAFAKGDLQNDTSIKAWVQTAWFVPEGTLINEVLQLMQKYHLDIVMVREEEVNGTAGLVTLNDLVHEIIGGDDAAGHDSTPPIQELDNHTFIVQAQTDLDEVNENLGLELPIVDDYQTLGGFLLFQLQKLPLPGEVHHLYNLEFTIISTDGPRLDQIQIHKLELGIRSDLPTHLGTTTDSTPNN
ncbi:hemolysin family protein [Acaryochloris marina]|uniref:hemolysin family protein n=1 Tax=Acaryochloris marina TaxID=155978 RepID=UPI001BB0A512|nr:hemolysin family protein [Acaryochloris marina]QUY42467.1 HlyC/CorC family transporter [Acaryochloris marina S15]